MNASSNLRKQIIGQALSLLTAILVALALGVLMLVLDGFAPGDVFRSAFSSTFGSSFRFANMLARLMTITLVALAAAVPFKAGIWNIGGDGQLAIGGFCAALVGFSLTGLPPVVHIALAVLAGMLGGALWAAIPAFLRLNYRANEIVTTIMMNYLATLLTGYLVNYPFRAPGSSNAETSLVQESAILTNMVPLSNLSTGIFLVIVAFIVIYILDKKTVWGYEWRVLGANEEFGRYGGVSDKKMRFLAMCVGGALAGLAGAILVLGQYHKYMMGIGGDVGFTGVLITLIAANSPSLILFVSMIFAFLQSGVMGMESKIGVAVEFSDILESVIILLVITRSKLWAAFTKLTTHRKNYGNVR